MGIECPKCGEQRVVSVDEADASPAFGRRHLIGTFVFWLLSQIRPLLPFTRRYVFWKCQQCAEVFRPAQPIRFPGGGIFALIAPAFFLFRMARLEYLEPRFSHEPLPWTFWAFLAGGILLAAPFVAFLFGFVEPIREAPLDPSPPNFGSQIGGRWGRPRAWGQLAIALLVAAIVCTFAAGPGMREIFGFSFGRWQLRGEEWTGSQLLYMGLWGAMLLSIPAALMAGAVQANDQRPPPPKTRQ